MENIEKKYSNNEITIVWKPKLCIHSGECVKGMPHVFNPKEVPWIALGEESTEELKTQIDKCPSGALSYINLTEEKEAAIDKTQVEVASNGPLLVFGDLEIKNIDGTKIEKSKVTAFCRCGHSANKPYCDGAHKKINFIG